MRFRYVIYYALSEARDFWRNETNWGRTVQCVPKVALPTALSRTVIRVETCSNVLKHISMLSTGVCEGASTRAHIFNSFYNTVLKR
jgi:hypothetical protein